MRVEDTHSHSPPYKLYYPRQILRTLRRLESIAANSREQASYLGIIGDVNTQPPNPPKLN